MGNGRSPGASRGAALRLAGVSLAALLTGWAPAAALGCAKPVYLTFDSGHMGVAPLVARVLQRQQVKATFFLANEPTQGGGSSLDDQWAGWWRERAAEGHAFGSNTWDQVVWQEDVPGGFRVKASALKDAPLRTLSGAQYCEQLRRPAERFRVMTGQSMLPLFRAPGGKTSPALLQAARRCGYAHVGWSPAGFLGDDLPSERYPNDKLLKQALRDIRTGDVLQARLGSWSRHEPWAPAALEPLIAGLKQRGFCFATLREHPRYAALSPGHCAAGARAAQALSSGAMKEMLDAFWRAVAYCLHPRVIVLSLLPLVVAGGTTWVLGYFFWEAALDAVDATLRGWSLMQAFSQWLQAIGAGGLRSVLPPLIVVALAVPVIVVFSLLLVALLMAPALTRLVAARRFPALEKRQGGGWWSSLAWSAGCTVVALVALVFSIPLWFVPPLVLIVPPLIWGWLNYRVMTFDVLAEHASTEERRRILNQERWPLLAIGVISGYLGAAPSLLWAMGAFAVVLAPVLILASIWLYTLVFAFSALWFAHYALAALQRLRLAEQPVQPAPPIAAPEPPMLPPL